MYINVVQFLMKWFQIYAYWHDMSESSWMIALGWGRLETCFFSCFSGSSFVPNHPVMSHIFSGKSSWAMPYDYVRKGYFFRGKRSMFLLFESKNLPVSCRFVSFFLPTTGPILARAPWEAILRSTPPISRPTWGYHRDTLLVISIGWSNRLLPGMEKTTWHDIYY